MKAGDIVYVNRDTVISVNGVCYDVLHEWQWWKYIVTPIKQWLIRQHCHFIGKGRFVWWM